MPWLQIFYHDVTSTAKEITEWVEIGIDCYIPHKRFQLKPHSSAWFTPSCATTISHYNHYFHQYHRNVTPKNKKLFCDSRNHCKKVLKDARFDYAKATRRSVASQLNGSCDFWRICNSINNSLPYLFNGPEVLTTSIDKANLFSRNFSCNSTLDDGSQQLTDFPSHTEKKLSSKNITAKMVSSAIHNLDASTIKPLAQTEFQPLSLRCVLHSFLLFLLSYTIGRIFLPVGTLHRLCQFLKMMERDLVQVSIIL